MRFQSCTIALLTIAMSVASAQVASHKPSTMQPKMGAQGPEMAPISEVSGKVVARVNGVELTDRDLVREMVTMFPYAQQHNGFPKDLEPEIRRGAMQMIIFEELLYQQAKRRNLTIPAARLNQAEAAFTRQFQTPAEFQSFLSVEGLKSKQELREKIRRSLLIETMLKTDVAAKVNVTPAQVKAFYDKNPKQFFRTETFHIQSISVLPPNNAPDNLKEAKKKAEEAFSKAKTAKTYKEFGLLAEKYSDDDFHVNYGDHKPVPRTQLPPEIVKAALAMNPGQVSGLIQLGNAYTIFRLIAHTPAGTVPFVEVKVKLSTDMQNQKTEQVRAALGQALRKNAKIEIL